MNEYGYNEAMVYADVMSVTQREGGNSPWVAKFNVKCTLAGPYDSARFPILDAETFGHRPTGWPPLRLPKVNSHVVVHLWCIGGERADSPWHIAYSVDRAFMLTTARTWR